MGHPLRERVVILDCSKAADRLRNLWEPWVAKRQGGKEGRPSRAEGAVPTAVSWYP